MRFLIFPNHNGEEGGKKKGVTGPLGQICAYRLARVSEVRRRNKTGVELARGGSDFVHCHCNFLAGRSFRGVTHHGGITYRWLFVRTSPSVIICLVTRPLTAYICPVFPSISTPSRHCPFVSNHVFRHCIVEFRKVYPRDACSL